MNGKHDPELYEKLISVDTSFEERVRQVSHAIAGITGVKLSQVVGKMIAKRLTEVIASKAGCIQHHFC